MFLSKHAIQGTEEQYYKERRMHGWGSYYKTFSLIIIIIIFGSPIWIFFFTYRSGVFNEDHYEIKLPGFRKRK